MRFIPFARLMLHSDSPPALLEKKLASLAATRDLSLSGPGEPQFRGSVDGWRFEFVRVLGSTAGISHRNSWQPLIAGELVPVNGGTEVRVTMRLQPLPGVITAAWLLFVLNVGIDNFRKYTDPVLSTGALVMALGVYVIVNVAFWTEVERARRALCDGLGCSDV